MTGNEHANDHQDGHATGSGHLNGHEIQLKLLATWFGGANRDPIAASTRLSVWFEADPSFDAQLRSAFDAEVEAAARGERSHWAATPHGALALVILLDQVPRNIHRGSPRAFAHDAHAQEICLGTLGSENDSALHAVERAFLLMPLQHAEDDELQARSVSEYERLVAGTPEPWREPVERFLVRAREHDEIIARFGRFPHRNAILGRESTPDELAFLAAGGPRYGQ
jgi:uncharacterized protein (DUF924 family)